MMIDNPVGGLDAASLSSLQLLYDHVFLLDGTRLDQMLSWVNREPGFNFSFNADTGVEAIVNIAKYEWETIKTSFYPGGKIV
jgi:hypothetical protein